MTLDRLIGRIALIGGVALSSYTCDSSSDPASCMKDSDCKGERLCEKNVCVEGKTSSKVSNPCGNSPLYGKHMWEFSGCKFAFHMREDCIVGVSMDHNQGYDYQYKDQTIKYNGLNINYSTFGQFSFDPSVRFVDSPNQNPKWKKVNEALDKYGGYVRLTPDCKITHLDDCAFVSRTIPFESMDQCKASSYYVHN